MLSVQDLMCFIEESFLGSHLNSSKFPRHHLVNIVASFLSDSTSTFFHFVMVSGRFRLNVGYAENSMPYLSLFYAAKGLKVHVCIGVFYRYKIFHVLFLFSRAALL